MAKVITKEMFTNKKPRKIILLRKIMTRHWTGKVEKNSGSEIEMGRKSCDRGMLGVWWADNGKVMGHWGDSSAECNSSLCYICNTLNLCYICNTLCATFAIHWICATFAIHWICATFALHWICVTFALHFCTTMKLQTAIFVQGKERLHFTERLLDLEQSLSCWTSVLEILTVEVTGENILPVCCIAEPFVQAPIPPPWWVGSKSPPGPLSSEKRRL